MMSGRPKYYPSKDKTHTPMTHKLEEKGYDVFDVSNLPAGFDVVVCGIKNVPQNAGPIYCCVKVEIKVPGKKLNENEKEYWANQKHGLGKAGVVAESWEDVDDWFGGYRNIIR